MADETKPAKSDIKAEKAEENKPALVGEPVKSEPAKAPEAKPVEAPPDAHNIAVIAAKVVAEMAASESKAPSRVAGSDKTVPGGKYVVDGVELNAWGEPYVEGQNPTNRNRQ